MRISRLRRWLVAVLAAPLLVTGCTGDADPVAPSAAQAAVDDHAGRSDDLVERVLEPDEPGCSAAVGIEGEVVWTGARGVADLSTGRPIETSTTFAIASVSKQFTAIAVLLLAHDGLLSLDDPLSTWLPNLPTWSNEVTIGQAMHHVSGIPDYHDLRREAGIAETEPRTLDDRMTEIAAIPALEFSAGDRFDYSNSNYVLMGEVVHAVAGRPLPDVVSERIFEPLGLAMHYDPYTFSPDSTDPTSARGYVRNPATGAWEPAGTRWEMTGEGGIETTPSELVRWADNYRTGEVGGDRLLADVMAGGADAGTDRYGAGIGEDSDGALGHGGGVPGHRTDFFVSADRNTAIAVACNGDRGSQSSIVQLAAALRTEWIR